MRTDGPFGSMRDTKIAAASTALGTIGYLLVYGTRPLGTDFALVCLCVAGGYGLAVAFSRTFDPLLDPFDRRQRSRLSSTPALSAGAVPGGRGRPVPDRTDRY